MGSYASVHTENKTKGGFCMEAATCQLSIKLEDRLFFLSFWIKLLQHLNQCPPVGR